MSTDTNSMLSAIFDTTVNSIQQQQKQDALNYQVHELKVCITDLLAEVEKIEQKIDFIANRGGSCK
jgi:peptidoglycan hydrolase CwlO-like protein